jgi:hypothetical protein
MPTVNSTLQEVVVDQLLPSLGWMDNIQAGVIPYGFGLRVEFPITAGVQAGAFGAIQAGVRDALIDDPVTPVAVHLGQGVVLFAFDHPNPSLVDYYEVLASVNLLGPYSGYLNGRFRQRRGLIRNVPLGTTAYFQIRAVGKNGGVSTAIQVKKGKLISPTLVNMKIRGIAGSVIPANAIFSSIDQETGMLVMIRAQSEIVLA